MDVGVGVGVVMVVVCARGRRRRRVRRGMREGEERGQGWEEWWGGHG